MEVLQFLHKMLGGSSPQTGYIGSFTIITTLVDMFSGHVQAVLAETGTPTNKLEWFILLAGIGLRVAKDANKSNSAHPAAVSVTVPAVSAHPAPVAGPGTVS